MIINKPCCDRCGATAPLCRMYRRDGPDPYRCVNCILEEDVARVEQTTRPAFIRWLAARVRRLAA